MACFTFTGEEREHLTWAICGNTEGETEHESPFAALLDELSAGTGPIEITVMALDREPMPT